MPTTPEQLKALRQKFNYTQADAAEIVRVTPRTWLSWEIDKGKDNHRVMPEGLLELFCMKHKIDYQVVDGKIHIV